MHQQPVYTAKQFDLSGFNVTGFTPIVVMDGEHAFVLDYQPSGRPKQTFFSNINWHAVDQRVRVGATAGLCDISPWRVITTGP